MVEPRPPAPGPLQPTLSARPERAADTASDRRFVEALAALAGPRDASPATSDPDILVRHYGLSGLIGRLTSEVEETADVTLPDGERLILKTASRPEARGSFAFQASVLAALAGAPGFVVPQVRRTAASGLTFADAAVCGYLQTRLDGSPLHRAGRDPALLGAVGRALGAMDAALAPLAPPALHRPVLWNVEFWPKLLTLDAHLPAEGAAEVREAMRAYGEKIRPRLGALAWQVTHNDPSPFNTLVTDHGIGFIDFGDGGWGPRIQDLAIAAGHVATDPEFPLGGAEPLIAGYASVLPLSAPETASLVGLMRARQAALILVNAWRSALFPAEAAYINKNVARARLGLSILSRLGDDEAERAVMAAASP